MTAVGVHPPAAVVQPDEDAPSSLPLVRRLAAALAEAGVAYCHWKSTDAIARSLTGENDLDLLVAREDVRPFGETLSALGFARARSAANGVPGIESFFGFDVEAASLVHVHAHYQLLVGHDRTKNYRLPIEVAYLRATVGGRVLRLPAPELEYAVLVLRMTLKHCTWDEILWAALRGRRSGPSPRERRELIHLQAAADRQRVTETVRENLPFVGGELFAECEQQFIARTSVRERVLAARRLERALQPYARRSRRRDRAERMLGRVRFSVACRLGRRTGQRLVGGGTVIGVVGGDGAGKSTAIAGLREWLRSELDVRVVHLGKPRWSATTWAVRGLLKAAADGSRGAARVFPARRVREMSRMISDYRQLIWLGCTARDRNRAYRRARRAATAGAIVLCDRYPHPLLAAMEAPLIARRSVELGRGGDRVVGAMVRLEEHYHAAIRPPDLFVVLRVDPETAVARKHDESPRTVRARGAEVWSIDWQGTGVHVVDAVRPVDDVARDLRALVWSAVA